jgi:hypothetical protein
VGSRRRPVSDEMSGFDDFLDWDGTSGSTTSYNTISEGGYSLPGRVFKIATDSSFDCNWK